MEQLAHIASIAASVATIVAPPAILLGVAPRVGPLRALSLGLSSRLFLRAKPASQRTQEVAALRSFLTSAHKNPYTVVVGPTGVGKTCIVDTTTERTFGVVSVSVPPGTPHATIVTNTLLAITRINHRAINPTGSARRVLWWHRLIFREPVTVVLRGAERKSTQEFADLDSAAKLLCEYDGLLRVVIDASDNSLDESAKATMREDVIEVGPMSRSVLESMPELADLLSALKAADLSDVVWECLGGVPAAYMQLLNKWKKAGSDEGREQLEAVVEPFLVNMLNTAIKNRSANTLANPRLEKELYSLFRTQSKVPRMLLDELELTRPAPDKVLRVKSTSIVPANAWTAVVLRFDMQEPPRLHELKKMLCTTTPPTPSTSNI